MKNRVKRILSLFFTASLLGSEFAPIAALAAEDRFAQTVSEDAEDDASGNEAEVISEAQYDGAIQASVDAGSYDATITVKLADSDVGVTDDFDTIEIMLSKSEYKSLFDGKDTIDWDKVTDDHYDFYPSDVVYDAENALYVFTFSVPDHAEKSYLMNLEAETEYAYRLFSSENNKCFGDTYTFTTKAAVTKTNIKVDSVTATSTGATYFQENIEVKISNPDNEVFYGNNIKIEGAQETGVSRFSYNATKGVYTATVYKDEKNVYVAVMGGADGHTAITSNKVAIPGNGFVNLGDDNLTIDSSVSGKNITITSAFNPDYKDIARLFVYYREAGTKDYTSTESKFNNGEGRVEITSLAADKEYEYYAEVYGKTGYYLDYGSLMGGTESMKGYSLVKSLASADEPLSTDTRVTKVTISGNTVNSIKPGMTRQFTGIITPENAAVRTLKWESSDTSVATVDNTGKVTGISEGKAKIKASAEDESGQYAEVEITVADKAVKGISINEGEAIEITKGTSKQLTFTTDPKDATVKSVSWKSSAPGIATVDNNGRVTGVSMNGTTLSANGITVSADKAVVTVEFTDEQGNTVSADITVKVTEPKPAADPSEPGEPEAPEEPADTTVNVSSVTIEEGSSAALKISGGSGSVVYGKLQLNASVSPENATNKGISFNSSNPAVASVNEKTGLVTAVNEGTAVITATSEDGGKTASITVTVTIEYEFDIADKKSSLSADVVLQPDGAEDTPDKFMTLAANGKKATLNKKLTKKGHSFKGWYVTYTDNKGVTKAKKISAVNASVLKKYAVNGKLTLKAVFKANTYTIKYNKSAKLDGKTVKVSGKAAAEKKAYMSNGAVATVTLAVADAFKPRENDIKFLGWTTKKNGSAVEYGAGATVSLADILPAKGKNITFYPVWGK